VRAGPLSSTTILQILEQEFVNSWVLARDLPALAAGASDPEVRATIQLIEKSYLYPVDSQILAPWGELLDHVCANDLHGDAERRYLELLDSAFAPPEQSGR
jgi:hypothetical protein